MRRLKAFSADASSIDWVGSVVVRRTSYTDTVSEAVARASGMRLGDYIKQNIFEPLGVKVRLGVKRLCDAGLVGLLGASYSAPADRCPT